MEPAIMRGSRVATYSFGDTERGDILFIDATKLDIGGQATHVIRRAIAFEGETISFENDQIFIDGLLLFEPYLPTRCQIYNTGPT